MQELAVLMGPFNIVLLPVLYGTLVLFKPGAMFNPFSALSRAGQTELVLVFVATMEALSLLTFLAQTFFLVMLAILFFQKCIEDTREQQQRLSVM